MILRRFTAAVFAAIVSAGAAQASVIGFTNGPNSSFGITLGFVNVGTFPVISLTLDGSTAAGGPIVWDDLGTAGGTAVLSGSSGADTQLATYTFSSFDFADMFILTGVDPDFAGGSPSVSIADLIGVGVTANILDGTSIVGSFVDNPGPESGLIFNMFAGGGGANPNDQPPSPVPLPASALLMLAGMLSLGAFRMRRRAG